MMRQTVTDASMSMLHGELGWRHNFTERHFIDFSASYDNWKMDEDNVYQDSTTFYHPMVRSMIASIQRAISCAPCA